jgi:hypothetical protein
LHADEIAGDRLMRAGQLAEHRELPGSLEDPLVEGRVNDRGEAIMNLLPHIGTRAIGLWRPAAHTEE